MGRGVRGLVGLLAFFLFAPVSALKNWTFVSIAGANNFFFGYSQRKRG